MLKEILDRHKAGVLEVIFMNNRCDKCGNEIDCDCMGCYECHPEYTCETCGFCHIDSW